MRFLTAVVVLLLLLATPAMACSPAPWDFASLQVDARALVQVHIVSVSPNGRAATARVLDYIGPGTLPDTIDLPPTMDSTAGAAIQPPPCPDFSLRWEPGSEYLVLLREVTPTLALLDPSGKTAFGILKNGRVQTATAGIERPATELLTQFAVTHHYPRRGAAIPWLYAVAGVVTLSAAGTAAWLINRRARRPA